MKFGQLFRGMCMWGALSAGSAVAGSVYVSASGGNDARHQVALAEQPPQPALLQNKDGSHAKFAHSAGNAGNGFRRFDGEHKAVVKNIFEPVHGTLCVSSNIP